jgi:hypothetical protein
MRPVAIPETGVFIERRPIIGVAAVEEPPGDGAGYMDDLDTIRRCSSGSQWEYLAGIGKFMECLLEIAAAELFVIAAENQHVRLWHECDGLGGVECGGGVDAFFRLQGFRVGPDEVSRKMVRAPRADDQNAECIGGFGFGEFLAQCLGAVCGQFFRLCAEWDGESENEGGKTEEPLEGNKG